MARVVALAVALLCVSSASVASAQGPSSSRRLYQPRSRDVLTRLATSACVTGERAAARSATFRTVRARLCEGAKSMAADLHVSPRLASFKLMDSSEPDGTLLQRVRLAADTTAAVDVVTYVSSGLVVAGIVCYPNDGAPHSAVIHLHGGMGGIFVNPDGDMLQTCWNWASLHGRTAFAPSLRGQDGGEGQLELCLGEADDVVAGAKMLRSLEVTDPNRVALVGGSVGGCIALRAGPRIPDLAAVVAFVPPISWKDMVRYHTDAWQPRTTTTCEGDEVTFDVGGPPLAAVIDGVICGHAGCSDEDYNKRTPLPLFGQQSAPTLVIAAGDDNIVPIDQQVLWSVVRHNAGHPVWATVVDVCAPSATPPLVHDGLIVIRDGFHSLGPRAISTGLLFLLAQLDARTSNPVAQAVP